MVARLGLSSVRIDDLNDKEHGSGSDWQSPTASWLKKGEKGTKLLLGAMTSPAVIVVMVVAMGDLKIKISVRGSCLSGQIARRWLTSAEKWHNAAAGNGGRDGGHRLSQDGDLGKM